MAVESNLLKLMGAWYTIGGVLTMLSAVIVVLVEFKLGALLAIPVFILLLLLGSSEFSSGRTIWNSEAGRWRNIITASLGTIGARLLFVYLLWGSVFTRAGMVMPWESGSFAVWLFFLNLAWLIGEAVFFVYLYLNPDIFMLKECDENRPDLATCRIKSASECPTCHEVVETFWQSCPYCGTKLPRACAECGGDLGDLLSSCPHCGAEIMQTVSMNKTVEMFRKMTEEKALPETKAAHFARLAEALLKNGKPEEAVDAYRQAIALTKYPRKRTNFMVQAARILANNGRQAEAEKLLDEALAIDPADVAGAGKIRSDMGGKTSPA
ncbi:MAG: tetratricopeptide repeat protein [Methanomassiliicoccus sp.]|nr:tetratricopeptide repeat protein [Methanomassiliicoccus sp.]